MKEITLETKIADLLNNYEGMKDILININPKFKKLNNPILRKTLAKIASVKQAAIVGGMEPIDLLNKIRKALGQEPIKNNLYNEVQNEANEISKPDWLPQNPTKTINANELLNNDENPLAVSFNILKNLKNGEVLAIESDFKPEPLIDEFIKKGYKVFCQEKEKNQFFTYILKS